VIRGITEACELFKTPVVGGNVSFYNETNGKGIYPTPTVGMVGLMDDVSKINSQWFKNEGDSVALLGELEPKELTQSEFLRIIHNIEDFPCPTVDLKKEKALQESILKIINDSLLSSAHDCSEGGLALALINSSLNPLAIYF